MRRNALLFIALSGLLSGPVLAESAPPANLQAALIFKLLPLYTNLGSDEFKIHVVGAPEIAELLKAGVGKTAGKAKLVSVTQSDTLPSEPVSVIYVGSNAQPAIEYAQSNGALTITGKPDLIKSGVTLGISLQNKKPKIFLNLKSSKAAGVDWNPAILKVAETIG